MYQLPQENEYDNYKLRFCTERQKLNCQDRLNLRARLVK